VGSGEYTNVNVKGSILYFGDTLYVTSADHVWALDTRDGLLAGHGTVLRHRAQRLQPALPDGPRSARFHGTGRKNGFNCRLLPETS